MLACLCGWLGGLAIGGRWLKLVLRRHLAVVGRITGRSGLSHLQVSLLQLRKPTNLREVTPPFGTCFSLFQ